MAVAAIGLLIGSLVALVGWLRWVARTSVQPVETNDAERCDECKHSGELVRLYGKLVCTDSVACVERVRQQVVPTVRDGKFWRRAVVGRGKRK